MSFQWLEMRIQEERERRDREAQILERLPAALEEVYGDLSGCIGSYTAAFGEDSAEIELHQPAVRIKVRERQGSKWQVRYTIEVNIDPTLPGFRIARGEGEALSIMVGILPGDKLFYRDGEEYIGMEELSRRILDRALFPKLTA
ncbi:MAG TPA: hypothetical protein VG096_10620 [Bryobacteraceae bacterium]|jgi:hypothetical protein|nr:hypothetical protein [Bryobacteraceae bacterium]